MKELYTSDKINVMQCVISRYAHGTPPYSPSSRGITPKFRNSTDLGNALVKATSVERFLANQSLRVGTARLS